MSSFSPPQYSGLALELRSCTGSETVDLDGANPTTIEANFTEAFATPFPVNAVPRITVIVGGGKLCRGKYHQDAFKTVAAVLRSSGYLLDSEGGDESKGGCYKSHHDTNKNLKTVVVFPAIAPSFWEAAEEGGGEGEGELTGEGLFDSASP